MNRMNPKEYPSRAVVCRLLSFARPHGGYLAGSILFSLLGVGLSLLIPILIGRGVDALAGRGGVDLPSLIRTLALLLGSLLASSLLLWLMGLCTNVVAQRTVRDLRCAAFGKLSRVRLAVIDGASHGDLITRITADMDLVSDGLIAGFTQLFSGVVAILGTLAFMLAIHPLVALVVIVLTPLSLLAAAVIARSTHRMFSAQSSLRGELGGCVEEMIGGQKVVKAFGYEGRAQERFSSVNARLHEVGFRAQFYSSLTNPGTRLINGFVYAAVGIAGALTAISGGMSVGQLASFLSYATQYTKPFNEISGVATELQNAFASARRVFALLDEPDELDASADAANNPNAAAPQANFAAVVFDDVSFSYRPDVPLIEHLNLSVSPGRRVAIVGPTGCGKTTLINLLMRFYDVDSGSILVGGVDVRDMPREALRSSFGMVLQDSWIFEGTVRDNIAYGRPGATDEEVEAAARAAYAHGFIRRLPQGYGAVLREDDLSAGQKQLLSIARVMLTKPPMLILDEATSSIDTLTELRVQKAFAAMMQGRTSFVVAHRLSTIREADVILVMDSGHIVEQGRHEELLARGGFYARLYNSQFAPTA